MKQTMNDSDTTITKSTGNVFQDLGLPQAELRQLKADAARQIKAAIDRKGITQKEAATIMGMDAQKVSNIVCGRLRGYTLDRLFSCLCALDVDVTVTMRPKPKKQSHAILRAM